jgi:hypothetical protein
VVQSYTRPLDLKPQLPYDRRSVGQSVLVSGHGKHFQTFVIFSRGVHSLTRGLVTVSLLPHLRLGSLSVASYDSQGYGGGILSRLHTDADSGFVDVSNISC